MGAGVPLRVGVPQALRRGTAGAVPGLWRPGNKGPEPQAVAPDLIRADENAGVAAEGRLGRDTVVAVKHGVARWL